MLPPFATCPQSSLSVRPADRTFALSSPTSSDPVVLECLVASLSCNLVEPTSKFQFAYHEMFRQTKRDHTSQPHDMLKMTARFCIEGEHARMSKRGGGKAGRRRIGTGWESATESGEGEGDGDSFAQRSR